MATHCSQSADVRRRDVASSTGSTVPSDDGTSRSASAYGALSSTVATWPVWPWESARSTKAAASPAGRSRGAKRAPVARGSPIRSTRYVRQSPRSTSQPTRYQRRPAGTSRFGSACRRVSVPSCER